MSVAAVFVAEFPARSLCNLVEMWLHSTHPGKEIVVQVDRAIIRNAIKRHL